MNNIWDTVKLLFPLNRSITGKTNQRTFDFIKKSFIPELEVKRIKSGSKVFDWEVPKEWNIRDAYVKNKFGKKIIDFSNSNLQELLFIK